VTFYIIFTNPLQNAFRWRDIRLEPNGPKEDMNVIFWVDSKTGEREVVALNQENCLVKYLQRIKILFD